MPTGNAFHHDGTAPTLWPPSIEREEYISPQECLRRMSQGAIDPMRVRPAACDPETGMPGGFFVELDEPRIDFMKLPDWLRRSADV